MEKIWPLNTRKLLAKTAENWPAKVLSVALAILLVVFRRMSIVEERFFSVPLIVQTESNLIPASVYTRMIRVSVRGDPAGIRSMLESDIEAYIDLKGKGKGTYRVPVQIRNNGTALGGEPLEIQVEPLEISVVLDYKISKYVPLAVNTQGSPKQGYALISYTLRPAQVIIDGPSDLMSGIAEFYTDVIDLEGKSEDFSVMVSILNRDPLVVIRGEGLTEFHGIIKEILMVGNFDNLPITVQGLKTGWIAELETQRGSVRLEGNRQVLETYVPPPDLLALDCSALTQPGTYQVPVSVRLSPSLRMLRQEPETVTVHIRNRAGGEPGP
ncbi:MAG: hypothetical protein LBU17_01535 [Treponema sp.]|jgi:YbbR domain-containing protein|nr:hypothetical protein [Treponema sp.]